MHLSEKSPKNGDEPDDANENPESELIAVAGSSSGKKNHEGADHQ
jgi:hypothetical protein